MGKKFRAALVLTVIGLALGLILGKAQPSLAMTGLDFIQLRASQLKHVVEPIIISYVAKGYKKVPSWSRLSSKMKSMILARGYGSKDISQIAFEAAMEMGMKTE